MSADCGETTIKKQYDSTHETEQEFDETEIYYPN